MRRLALFTLLFGALWLIWAEDVSARCHRRCHHRCRHHCHRHCHYCGHCGHCGTTCCAMPIAHHEAQATIVVHLPADATLTVDGQATTSTSAVRTFVTPNLPAGQNYSYTLQARLPGGEVVTQQVNFRAGEQTTVRFEGTGVAVTQR